MALIRKARAERDFNGRHLLRRRIASRFFMIYAITMWSVEVRRPKQAPREDLSYDGSDEGFGKGFLHAFFQVQSSVLRWLTWESETYSNGD
jgi:hypothetical protein